MNLWNEKKHGNCFIPFFPHPAGQALVVHQVKTRELRDPTVLPDLCNSHKKQLSLMMKNHHSLSEMHQRCLRAKNELSTNLHGRLK